MLSIEIKHLLFSAFLQRQVSPSTIHRVGPKFGSRKSEVWVTGVRDEVPRLIWSTIIYKKFLRVGINLSLKTNNSRTIYLP